MLAAAHVRSTLVRLGYKATEVLDDYKFAAVDQPGFPVQEISIAAFFDSPPSYRTAALGVVKVLEGEQPQQVVERQISLGAAYLIAIGRESVSAWTFTARGVSKLDEAPLSEWESFSAKHAGAWNNVAIRRLKAVQLRKEEPAQGVLFDTALLYKIQVQVQQVLDSLLGEFLAFFGGSKSPLQMKRDYRIIFPLAFRLLAAKILFDREDARIATIDGEDAQAVIEAISRLYSLPALPVEWNPSVRSQLQRSWGTLRAGVHVRNIAADDLAFVYENTLITPSIRKAFGTHSTPPSVAEYVVRSFVLPEGADATAIRVYEPFAGSCVFLTAAMRRFKEVLPPDWPVEKVHQHLVSNFVASEIDQFACEIARLALILADYPMANGWKVHNEDLFETNVFSARLENSQMVMCNPPFEDFESANRNPSIHKPIAALTAILDRKPQYLGIVMPWGFDSLSKFQGVSRRVVEAYRDIELLSIPEGIFKHATVGATVLIAQSPRAVSDLARIKKSVVYRSERVLFEQTLRPSVSESVDVDPMRAPGFIGLKPLRDLWTYLANYRRLGDIAELHRGLEWNEGRQNVASTAYPAKGSRRGLHNIAESLAQFRILGVSYLDCRPEALRRRAIDYPWSQPKVLCTAARTSRGPWRLAACKDETGLLASQQFFGIWLRENSPHALSLDGLAAVLNSPLANAYSYAHESEMRLSAKIMKALPIPGTDPGKEVIALIAEYRAALSAEGPLFASGARTPVDILMEIDAVTLRAYDLPPRLEKMLLKLMNADKRPCGHPFGPYPGTHEPGAIPLNIRLSMKASPEAALQEWKRLLTPLPAGVDVFDEA